MNLRTLLRSSVLAVVGLLILSSAALAAEGEVGDLISDGLLGNEPNIITSEPWEDGGPQELEPGELADPEVYVIPSGAPGPITCGESWWSPAQIVSQGNNDNTRPGNPDAPGMNVDCAGDEKPHTP